MRINFDRLSKLAGLPGGSSSRRRSLNENADLEKEGAYEEGMDPMDEMYEDDDHIDALAESDEIVEPGMDEDKEADDEAMIDVDEAMLVQELRRAKRIMQENKRRKQLSESRKRQRKQRIFEAQLRQVIDEEVQNVFDEMNYSNGWVYGKNKPRRSRNGYTHQGSYIPGIGFRR